MGNVLGELFGDIAEAIREKTGDAGSMKPAEFPEKISGIVTSGSGQYYFYNSYFTAKDISQEVTHYMGRVPDIIYVYYSKAANANRFYYSLCYSRAMIDRMPSGKSRVSYIGTSGAVASMDMRVGIDDAVTNEDWAEFGGVRNATDKSFTVGGSSARLESGKYYYYIAITNITG